MGFVSWLLRIILIFFSTALNNRKRMCAPFDDLHFSSSVFCGSGDIAISNLHDLDGGFAKQKAEAGRNGAKRSDEVPSNSLDFST